MTKTVKSSPDEPEAVPESRPESARPAAARMGGIKNAPAVTNTGGYELRTAPARLIVAKMAGHNAGGYESRAVQESGTH
jgi:hypothetical protein